MFAKHQSLLNNTSQNKLVIFVLLILLMICAISIHIMWYYSGKKWNWWRKTKLCKQFDTSVVQVTKIYLLNDHTAMDNLYATSHRAFFSSASWSMAFFTRGHKYLQKHIHSLDYHCSLFGGCFFIYIKYTHLPSSHSLTEVNAYTRGSVSSTV